MRMLELLELSQILKDLVFFFFNLFPFFCSVGQFVLIYLYWFILIYWTISLLNFFFLSSPFCCWAHPNWFFHFGFIFYFSNFSLVLFISNVSLMRLSIHLFVLRGFALTSWCTTVSSYFSVSIRLCHLRVVVSSFLLLPFERYRDFPRSSNIKSLWIGSWKIWTLCYGIMGLL